MKKKKEDRSRATYLEQKMVGDLSSGTGHGNPYRWLPVRWKGFLVLQRNNKKEKMSAPTMIDPQTKKRASEAKKRFPFRRSTHPLELEVVTEGSVTASVIGSEFRHSRVQTNQSVSLIFPSSRLGNKVVPSSSSPQVTYPSKDPEPYCLAHSTLHTAL